MRNGSRKAAVENMTSFYVMDLRENICHSKFHCQRFHSLTVAGWGLEKLPYLRPLGPKKRPIKIKLTWICLRKLCMELIGEANDGTR